MDKLANSDGELGTRLAEGELMKKLVKSTRAFPARFLIAVLLVLAMAPYSEAACPTPLTVENARTCGLWWLLTHQKGDGSWRSTPGMEFLATSDALQALAASWTLAAAFATRADCERSAAIVRSSESVFASASISLSRLARTAGSFVIERREDATRIAEKSAAAARA